jgi:hypothetical protein
LLFVLPDLPEALRAGPDRLCVLRPELVRAGMELRLTARPPLPEGRAGRL